MYRTKTIIEFRSLRSCGGNSSGADAIGNAKTIGGAVFFFLKKP